MLDASYPGASPSYGYPVGPPSVSFLEGVSTRAGDPTTLYSAVGAATAVTVSPCYGHGLLMVTYQISGAVDPTLSSYSDQGGTYRRLDTQIVHDFHNQGGNYVGQDSLYWDWDETTGTHTALSHGATS